MRCEEVLRRDRNEAAGTGPPPRYVVSMKAKPPGDIVAGAPPGIAATLTLRKPVRLCLVGWVVCWLFGGRSPQRVRRRAMRQILVEGSWASSRIRTAPHRSPQRVRDTPDPCTCRGFIADLLYQAVGRHDSRRMMACTARHQSEPINAPCTMSRFRV